LWADVFVVFMPAMPNHSPAGTADMPTAKFSKANPRKGCRRTFETRTGREGRGRATDPATDVEKTATEGRRDEVITSASAASAEASAEAGQRARDSPAFAAKSTAMTRAPRGDPEQ